MSKEAPTAKDKGVFSTTAVDSTRIKSMNQSAKGYHSIVDIDPNSITSPPNFKELETKRAMMALGILPEDLVKLSKHDISKIPGTQEIKDKITAELEQRRLETIKNVIEERNKLMNEKNITRKSNVITTNVNNSTEEMKRFEKLKQKQIKLLISEQMKRKQIIQTETSLQQRLEEQKLEKERQIQLKKLQDAEKAQQQLERAKKIEQEKEEKAKEVLIKQQQEEEKRMMQQQEMQAKTEEERKAAAEKRKQKMEAIRDAQRAHEEEELLKAINALQQTESKQLAVIKRREQQIEALREKQRQNEFRYQKKIEALMNKDADEKQRNLEAIEKRQQQAAEKAAMEQAAKEAEILARKKREQEKLQLIRSRYNSGESNKEKLEREMKERQLRIEENLRALSCQRKQRIQASKVNLEKRSLSALNAKKEKEEMFARRAAATLKRQEDAANRALIVRQTRGNQIQERAAQEYLKQKLGEDNAKRMNRVQQYQRMAQAEKTKQKFVDLEEQKRQRQIELTRMKKQIQVQQNKEKDELKRLQQMIMENPNIDPQILAAQFNIKLGPLSAPDASPGLPSLNSTTNPSPAKVKVERPAPKPKPVQPSVEQKKEPPTEKKNEAEKSNNKPSAKEAEKPPTETKEHKSKHSKDKKPSK